MIIEALIAETGAGVSRFPSPGQLCAWAGVAPASYESAGKRRPACTRHGSPWLRRALIEAARAGARTHARTKGSYHQAQYVRIARRYVRIARRRGPNRPCVTVANSMLFTIWHLLSNGQLYENLGADYFNCGHDPAVEAKRLARRIEMLGYDFSVIERAA